MADKDFVRAQSDNLLNIDAFMLMEYMKNYECYSAEEIRGVKENAKIWKEKIEAIEEFYLSTSCHVCKSKCINLKRCSNCKLFAYCSTNHQKFHWKYHKEFCKTVNYFINIGGIKRHHIFNLTETETFNFAMWKLLKSTIKDSCEEKLGRNLSKAENQALMLPRVCEVCRCSKQDTLKDCSICHSVSYCSIEHQNNDSLLHNKYCKDLQLSNEINKLLFIGFEYPQISFNIKRKVPKNMNKFLNKCVVLNKNDMYSEILSSHTLSPVLTVLNALEISGLIRKRVCIISEIKIHVVGSSLYEESLDWKIISELIFKWIINLKELTIILIGPDILQEVQLNFQGETNTNIKFVKRFYHDYLNLETCIPDVIVGFNIGFHEFQNTKNDTWKKSLSCFFKYPNVCLIFTAYTELESLLDTKRLLKYCLKKNWAVVIDCQKNPFASLRPLRDWETENVPIFYVNGYLSVIVT